MLQSTGPLKTPSPEGIVPDFAPSGTFAYW